MSDQFQVVTAEYEPVTADAFADLVRQYEARWDRILALREERDDRLD